MEIATANGVAVVMGRFDVLSGYYGFGNFGDDLFMAILDSALSREAWSRPLVTMNSFERGRIANKSSAISNLWRARSVTLGGGSILGAGTYLSMRQLEHAAATWARVRYYSIGVGIKENDSGYHHRLIDRMDWVGLRSKAEYESLSRQHCNVHYTPDLAYSAAQYIDLGSRSTRRKGVLLIPASVGQLEKQSGDVLTREKWLKFNIVPMVKPGEQLTVLVAQSHNLADLAAAHRWESSARSLGLEVNTVVHSSVAETTRVIKSSRFVFSERLHGAIMAHSFGVPFRLSLHHTKCRDFLADVSHPDSMYSSPISDVAARASHEQIADWVARTRDDVSVLERRSLDSIREWIRRLELAVIDG